MTPALDMAPCCPACGKRSDPVAAGERCPTCGCVKSEFYALRPWVRTRSSR